MLIPLLIAGGIYGVYRYRKYQEQKVLDASLATTTTTPPGYRPTTAVLGDAPTLKKAAASVLQVATSGPVKVPTSSYDPRTNAPPSGSAYGMVSPKFQPPVAPTSPSGTPLGFAASGSIKIGT